MASPILEERFDYKGFPCVVLFQSMGHRCGYVGIPKGQKYYNVDYNEIPVCCHGGLTYSRSGLALQDDTEIWWIGFDCAHWGDAKDYSHLYRYYSNDNEMMKIINIWENADVQFGGNVGVICDFDYCKNECISIVDQLLEESEEQCNIE